MRRLFLAALAFAIGLSLDRGSLAGTFTLGSTAEQTRLMLELRAQQFLNRATFGATDAEVKTLADSMETLGVNAACSKWIDDQFALPTTYQLPTVRAFMTADGITTSNDATKNLLRYRYHAFWHNAIAAPDQLKQRIAWALIQIAVVGEGGDNFNFVEVPSTGTPAVQLHDKAYWFGMSSYYDVLLKNSDKRYRDLMQEVTYHPIMGVWLSSLRNRKTTNIMSGSTVIGQTFPDENYAREIMQLFAIGINQLNIDGTFKMDAAREAPLPTYDNNVIQGFAKVFTGLNYASGNGTSITSGYVNYVDPMIMTNSQHEPGVKNLFPGKSVAGNVDGNVDIREALDVLHDHENVGPFISKLLIQRLVRSNPSKQYIARVATVFNGSSPATKGDMKAVIKAILTDNEAWSSLRVVRLQNPIRLVVTGAGTEFSRLSEPVVQYASFFRRYGVAPSATNSKFYLNANPGNWSQAPFRSPSVFNFYLPTHQPPGGLATAVGSRNIPNGDLFAPEFQVQTAVSTNNYHNRTRSDIVNEYIDQTLYTINSVSTTARFSFNFASEKLLAHDSAKLVEHIDKVLCNGAAPDDFKARLVSTLNSLIPVSSPPTDNQRRDRVRGALLTIMNSPYYLIRY
jgi:uncharacterized protein (DUF1800 family)